MQIANFEFHQRFDELVTNSNLRLSVDNRQRATVMPPRRKFRSAHKKDIYHLVGLWGLYDYKLM